MRPLRSVLAGAIIATMLAAKASGQIFCPCVPGPYPAAPVVKDAWLDVKGGVWALICTNASATGDFVWVYLPPGGGKFKVLGRCVFVGGENCEWSIKDPATGNVLWFVHVCCDGGADDGAPWDKVVDIFCKPLCLKIRLCLNFVPGIGWVEDIAGRQITTAADFEAQDPADPNGDGIPDEGYKKLTEGLYPDPPPPLPALYETFIALKTTPGTAMNVTWDVGALTPTLDPGDRVEITNVGTADIVTVDPRFLPTDFIDPSGDPALALIAQVPVSPATGELLVALQPTTLAPPATRYAVVEQGAAEFYQDVFNDLATPIDKFGWSTLENLTDMPGYNSAMGMLDLRAPGAPQDRIATGPDSLADAYLDLATDPLGGLASTTFGGGGDNFTPAGGLPTAEATFTGGLYLFRDQPDQRALLSTAPDWVNSVDQDMTVVGTAISTPTLSDTNLDGVDDTMHSVFSLFGSGLSLSVDLTQSVEAVELASAGPGGSIAVHTQDYTFTNTTALPVAFTLVYQNDLDLVWAGGFANDVVGTATNAMPLLDPFVYQLESNNTATAVTLSSPQASAYVGAKRGVDPDGGGPDPAFTYGTDVVIWDGHGLPGSWRNHVAGVGTLLDGESGTSPPGCVAPCDGSTYLEIPVVLGAAAGPSATATVTITRTYGATTPAGAGAPCPWDCGDGNGVVDVIDFLALLSQWGSVGTSCDFDDGPGVGVIEFLALLGAWGACP